MTFNYTHSNTDVDSSLVYEAYYNNTTRELALVFDGGYGYVYSGVPYYVYQSLVVAKSPGGYYNDNIKRTYGPARTAGYVGFDNDDFFIKGVPAPDMGAINLSGNVSGPSLTFTPQTTGLSTTPEAGSVSSGYLTLHTEPRNTKRTFAVEFVSGGKVRTHTLDADNFGDAESAVLEIGNMLDLDFEVKGINVVE